MIRRIAAALALFLAAAAPALRADVGPAEVEEAADVARRAALDLFRSPPARLFLEALDTDGILVHRLGAPAWGRLAERQRERLRSGVAEIFLRTLVPARSPAAEIVWSAARPSGGDGVEVFFGLRYDDRLLKTRWALRRVGAGWRIADVVLVDPGVSLAASAQAALGPRPLERRTRGGEVWSNASPRAGAIAVLAVVVAAVASRIPRGKRPLLYWTAAAPAALLAIDGGLAIHRALSEPYVLRGVTPADRWRQSEQLALAAEREGRVGEARAHWARAVSAGGPPGPLEYQIGLAAQRHGDSERARAAFLRALSEDVPAPGAAKELASMEAARGRFAEAELFLSRYLTMAGPDPDSLSLLAVVQTNLGKPADALRTIREARTLIGGEGWRGEELEAQVHARAGDAPGCVAALRLLEAEGRLDRSAVRADPAYLPIATDPVWVAFLNEKVRK